jgi:hypothetical protein
MDVELIIFGRWEFRNPEQERKAINRRRPFGVTADLSRLANSSGNITRGASSLIEFAGILREVFEPPDARFKSLSIITHSDGTSLWLRGTLNADPESFVHTYDLTPRTVRERLRPTVTDVLKGKMLPDAKITLYGCHSGNHIVPKDLLDAFALAFDVDCFGFKRGLQVCVDIDKKTHKITDRGWIRIDDGSKAQGKTCEVAGFVRDLRKLVPDASRPVVRIR